MPNLPSGTVTFLFSDIEGSTQTLQRLGASGYARALGESQAILRAVWATHEGSEVDTAGDGFFVAFPSAPQAVAAAAEAVRALADHSWPEGEAISVRIGLHTGSPQLVGDHYVGLDVHRAARIAAAGHGGQILLSEATRALVEQALPDGASLRDLGPQRLKDLQHAERVSQLIVSGLPSDFPALKTLDRHAHNLPVQPTPLLGREEALETVCALLRRHSARLVTLTGPGGVGKTRLSLQVAAELVDAFADGVWFTRLSRLTDPSLVLPTIAATLGLKEAASQPVAETLRAYLSSRHALLVLDNFEQVTGAAAEIAALLESSPRVKALVTSRMPLRLRGEHEYPLVPLALPDARQPPSPERLSQYAAVALFIERAGEVRPGFTVTASNAPAIAEICARLDGLPLAIELAAVRVKLLPPEALLARLSSQLKLLTGGARDLEARQQTMRATIAWSEQLLSPAERILFRRLAVFVGGATLEAVEAVCLTPDGAEPLDLDVLDGLSALVDQSLVQQREEEGESRFGMLHVIREYALEQLKNSGEAEALRRAHASYFVTFAERLNARLRGPDQVAIHAGLEREHDNLRAMLDWSLDRREAETAARMCDALEMFWNMSGHWNEQGQWLQRTLSIGDALSPSLRVHLLYWTGYLAHSHGNSVVAMQAFDECLALFRAIDDKAGIGDVLARFAELALSEERYNDAGRLFEESLALARMAGAHDVALQTLKLQSGIPYVLGDLKASQAILVEALALAQRLNFVHDIAECSMVLGWLALLQRGDSKAEALLDQALAVQQQLNDTNCSARSLGYLGMVAWEQGAMRVAQERLDLSVRLFEQVANRVRMPNALTWRAQLRLASGDDTGAEEDARLGLKIAMSLRHRQHIAACLDALGRIAARHKQHGRAARLLGATAKVLDEPVPLPPLPLPSTAAARQADAVAEVRKALGEEGWAAAYAVGRALSLEEAIAEALGEAGAP